MTELAILVVHDVGDAAGGGPWREALARGGWPGEVIAPDLPGHGEKPAPVGGDYTNGDAVLMLVEMLPWLADLVDPDGEEGAERPADRPLVVGVGDNGWSAQVLALAGAAGGLVLVDGIGGPWSTPADHIAAGRHWLRGIADDPDATAPAPARGLDPRALHRVPSNTSRRLALKAASEMPVPVALFRSPASALGPGEVDEVARQFPRGAWVHEVASRSPDDVVPALMSWAGSTLVAAPQH